MATYKRTCGGRPGSLGGGCSLLMVAAIHFFFLNSVSARSGASHRKIVSEVNHPVHLQISKHLVLMDNGIVQVSLSNPGGDVVAIKYGGLENLLETRERIDGRGYLDINWNWPGQESFYDRIHGSKFNIINQTNDIVEISFVSTWDNSSSARALPVNIDQRYVMRRGISGFYYYVIFDHPEGWPAFEVDQTRVAFKLNGKQFHFMAISDDRQRIMPTMDDRDSGKRLAYPEAVLLTSPSNPDLKGEVDDKYQYSSESQDTGLHGWISKDPVVGFWMISTSDEFRNGGPTKQDLTSHVGPTTICTFMSTHYAGRDMRARFTDGEAWKKVFGPFFVYLNSDPSRGNYSALWEDAKNQMFLDVESWPYNFIQSEDFPSSSQRGSVTGQLLVQDRYLSKEDLGADSAYVGLAAPGEAGSWQTETKGYQFWSISDSSGNFTIYNVRAGVYNLYAWVPGIVGDYKYEANVTVIPGYNIQLGSIVFEPPRSGPTLWEIGVPDRTAAEFYVPEASPMLINKLYVDLKSDWFRQYGLWERYSELYPMGDLVFTIGKSVYPKDWFFAHVLRINGSSLLPTTWQVEFELQDVSWAGTYTLQLALASATGSEIQVRFNDLQMRMPLFTTKLIGSDNAIARHGIYGLYHFYSIRVPGKNLQKGRNTLFLTQSRNDELFCGVMYDYLRLEGPLEYA